MYPRRNQGIVDIYVRIVQEHMIHLTLPISLILNKTHSIANHAVLNWRNMTQLPILHLQVVKIGWEDSTWLLPPFEML